MMKLCVSVFLLLLGLGSCLQAQSPARPPTPARVILDTDIGDDIDDAYALALLLQSPEINIVGITTAFGDTQLRARLVSQMLKETGHEEIPVYAGPSSKVKNGFTQTAYAMKSPATVYPDAIHFMLDEIRKHPGQITLIEIAPLTNVGALLKADPATFLRLQRVVMMGGSIHRGYGDAGAPPDPEWNILCDVPSAKALFTSGVPLFVMPLDSTQIKLDGNRQKLLFARKTPLTHALSELTHEWSAAGDHKEPTLFDPVAATYALRPALCPATPMHIEVDDKGMTRETKGSPNASVCLTSSAAEFFRFYLPRVMR